MCETSELVIARRSAVAARQRWSTVTVLVNETGETLVGCHRVIEFWHWSSFCSCCFVLSLSLLLVLSAAISLSVSSTPLADSLTGSVPLANHSALIMRIISSHHSPRCDSSISSGLFTRHQPLHVNPFICLCVCVFVPQCAAHKITLNNI